MDRINAGIIISGLGDCIAFNPSNIILIKPKTNEIIPYVFAISITLFNFYDNVRTYVDFFYKFNLLFVNQKKLRY